MSTSLTRREALGLLGALALPLDRLVAAPDKTPAMAGAAASPAAPEAPDLANLYDLMAWVARENRPRLSFLDPQWSSLDAWKEAARPVFHPTSATTPSPPRWVPRWCSARNVKVSRSKR